MRKTTAISINHLCSRLPLILEVLDEIEEAQCQPKPGDEEIRNGAINAIQSILTLMKDLRPASPCETGSAASEPEKIASEWLIGELPSRLIPENLYLQLSSTISTLLPLSPESINR